MWILLLAIVGYFVLEKGGLSSIPGLSALIAPKLYQLTTYDVQAIAGQFSDGNNSYEIQDFNNPYTLSAYGSSRYSLAQAMALAIQIQQVVCYAGDGYCAGVGTPDSQTTVEAEGSNALAQISASDPEPISKTILSLASKVFGFIGAHHAAAVEKENSILCPLVPRLNGEYAAVLKAMQSGQINGATVMANVNVIEQQAQQIIATDSGSGALHAVGEEVSAITLAFQKIVTESGI